MNDIEDVAGLTSEVTFYRMEYFFAKPVNISLTMAYDSLLQKLLQEEPDRLDDEDYIAAIKEYLNAYQIKYNYDSVFLVSVETGRYYNFKGLDRVLTRDNPENGWYYELLASNVDYDLEVDNDEAGENEITVFVNCRIRDPKGKTLGIVGVGLHVNNFQAMLQKYEREFGVRTFLLAEDGTVEISSEKTGFVQENHFDACVYGHLKDEILSNRSGTEARSFWLKEGYSKNYIVARYIPSLSWHLIVEHDTGQLDREMRVQILRHLLVTILLTILILLITTRVIKDYNRQIVEITRRHEEERQEAVRKATEKLHGSIYAVNLTDDCAEGSSTRSYFKSFGVPADTPFSEMLKIIADSQVKDEFREGYINTFSPENALEAFSRGRTDLSYEFQYSLNGRDYHWTRIVAHLYQNNEDEPVYMISYHKNVDKEKRRELQLANKIQMDEMTGLYNKTATRQHIEKMLSDKPELQYAFFIFDIDNFKKVNDSFGHAVGDLVIATFAGIIKRNFRSQDVVGRFGGDEFVVFVPVSGKPWAENKAASLSKALDSEHTEGKESYKFSASIGVALAPADGRDFETLYKKADRALYATKQRGKNGYTLFENIS